MKFSTQYLDSVTFDNNEESLVYPFNVNSIKNLKHINFHPKVTFLIGENGSAKSNANT